jgi:hypothetical protein
MRIVLVPEFNGGAGRFGSVLGERLIGAPAGGEAGAVPVAAPAGRL